MSIQLAESKVSRQSVTVTMTLEELRRLRALCADNSLRNTENLHLLREDLRMADELSLCIRYVQSSIPEEEE